MGLNKELPTLKWGIIGTGLISTWFVRDILLDRKEAKAIHEIHAIGSSSESKGIDFVNKFDKLQSSKPFVGSYDEIYVREDVDIIYIGLPHVFHKEQTLKAIENGKHVLVEKPATINAKDFEVLIKAAKSKNVFLMEAVWVRFKPIILELQELIMKDKVIGDVYRMFADFGIDKKLNDLPDNSRLKNASLGAGSFLDIGIYPLTYARLFLDEGLGVHHKKFDVVGLQSLRNGIDNMSSAIIKYEDGKQAIITSSMYNNSPENFLKIDGELGTIEVGGIGGSMPSKYKITFKNKETKSIEKEFPSQGEHGLGFQYEADAVAEDISKGKIQNDLLPLDESLLVLQTLDEIRRQGGLVYPQEC